MELSIREIKARFSEAAAAAARGERVLVTKNGQPFVELVPAKPAETVWDKLQRAREELGIKQFDGEWDWSFDDPAFSREVLGLDDD